MEWYNYALIAIFLYIVFSPVWFFKQVEKFILRNDIDEQQKYLDQPIDPMHIIHEPLLDEYIDHDMKAIENFNRIIKNSKKRHVKQLWRIKKAEYIRGMQWRVIGGTEHRQNGETGYTKVYR